MVFLIMTLTINIYLDYPQILMAAYESAEVLSTSDDSTDFHARKETEIESHIANDHDFLTATLETIYPSYTLSDLG